MRREPSRRRRYTDRGMSYAKRAVKGALIGAAIAVPLSFAAQRWNMPVLFEAGERLGAIAASKFGGTIGQIGFQALDAGLERVLPPLIAGGPGGLSRVGQVYG